jgi:hypothetical protein
MLDRREALTNISKVRRAQVSPLLALNLPSDHDIPQGIRLLLDAIDHLDVAAGGNLDQQVAA